MRVETIMVKEVITLKQEMNVQDAMQKLMERKISGLPVVDDNNKVVGMFTEKSILMEILPSYVEKVGHFVYEVDPKKLIDKVEKLHQIKVKEIMRKEVITVKKDTSLTEVAKIMLVQKIRRIPVVDDDNSLIGLIARQDVLKFFSKKANI
ncbi:MAG: CBS domain-containing protein [Candidatus Omnitrophota bacterium]